MACLEGGDGLEGKGRSGMSLGFNVRMCVCMKGLIPGVLAARNGSTRRCVLSSLKSLLCYHIYNL